MSPTSSSPEPASASLREQTQALLRDTPIIQAPMAGATTPELAAAVSNAGGLGSLGIGGADPTRAAEQIARTAELTERPFMVNFFAHAEPRSSALVTQSWLRLLEPEFAAFATASPGTLRAIYASAATPGVNTQRLVDVLAATRPAVVSFHFGLPAAGVIEQLHDAGILVFVTATTPEEARLVERAGADAVVAQGREAGGHRGVFDSTLDGDVDGDAHASRGSSTLDLVAAAARAVNLPLIAAGGLMNGVDVARALDAGAAAAQLGTVFLLCPEAATGPAHRERIREEVSRAHGLNIPRTDLGQQQLEAIDPTAFTSAVSGRPARGLRNRMHEIGVRARKLGVQIPAYPLTYDAGKALAAAASAHGDATSFAAHWAGSEVGRAREMPAADLVRTLVAELKRARG
ncbi:nitronate monooxygenase [Pseudoclavibacter sp. CFCC 14310]|uniref:NAD(P)H-dependent flavin oxidoreductase n=1 Tax=Pseudoclavibacter sp. CFCC 14310 TaxID=2615180 RepID=UPI001301453B|nr:nitronate monooxygenase [Pseudoclavibacter sp. CFCC 14310]KAB1647372.1 nitronate monooxygenase [Pseudoclavibacter sp. CFCC 14310]